MVQFSAHSLLVFLTEISANGSDWIISFSTVTDSQEIVIEINFSGREFGVNSTMNLNPPHLTSSLTRLIFSKSPFRNCAF